MLARMIRWSIEVFGFRDTGVDRCRWELGHGASRVIASCQTGGSDDGDYVRSDLIFDPPSGHQD
jgi:hypothetical protein